MLNKLVIFILILCSFIATAQTDIYYNRSKSIPSSGTNSGYSTGSSLSLPSITKDPKLPSTSYQKPSFMTEQPKDIGFTLKKETFVNPGDKTKSDLQNKINQQIQEGDITDLAPFKRDIDFGLIKTERSKVIIRFRDYGMIDGDYIKIVKDNSIHTDNIFIGYDWKEYEIFVNEGFNKIDIVALNMGTSMPNTTQLEIYDSSGILLQPDLTILYTGFKASIVSIKE